MVCVFAIFFVPDMAKQVRELWRLVRPGGQFADFEANLSGNLYKLWNRMSSGSYFPPPVRRVDIPKASGGIRPLGIDPHQPFQAD